MISLLEMEKWNYKTAWEFFTREAFQKYIPETEIYIRSLPLSETFDLRRNYQARSIIMNSINKNSLILIDGPSASGKTTFAKRLAKKTNAIIVDIDLLCIDWLNKQDKKNIYALIDFDRLTDQYLLDELENIIKEKSRYNRPVILVGFYMEIIYRSIIARTLGKYFQKMISIVCCEESFEKVVKMIESRNQKFRTNLPNEKKNTLDQYNFVKEFVDSNSRIFLGVGMDMSFIVDTEVSDMFK